MTFGQAMDALAAKADDKVRRVAVRQGAGEQFGVKLGDIRALAKSIKSSHPLALELWASGCLDAQLLACLILKPDRPVGGLKEGWICERVNLSDWELGGIGVGGIFDGSCWCESSLLLTCMEIPGLYLRPSDGFAAAMDHIEAGEPVRNGRGWAVSISNPTPFTASVRVWIDENPALPHPDWFATDLKVVDLLPGETKQLHY